MTEPDEESELPVIREFREAHPEPDHHFTVTYGPMTIDVRCSCGREVSVVRW